MTNVISSATKPTTVLVTGATGFVGSALVQRLHQLQRRSVRQVVRRGSHKRTPLGTSVEVESLTGQTDWSLALKEVNVVIHLAARTHVVAGNTETLLAQFREVNTAATLHLAEQASRAGVSRFVFVSSIKVLGEASSSGRPFSEDSPYAPVDAYGISKMEAELGLLHLAQTTSMEIVIIRPPLVYGPGMESNFGLLMQAVARHIPMPFVSIQNLRSFVSVDNLVDFITICVEHPLADNQIFGISDGVDLSTPELIHAMAAGLGCKPMLFPFPVSVLQSLAMLFGKQAMFQRLCGNLQVDISKARQMLGWHPVVDLQEALHQCHANKSGP